MGIRFQCPGCQGNLNVKTYLAGRRGICPKCKTRLTIPTPQQVPLGANESPAPHQPAPQAGNSQPRNTQPHNTHPHNTQQAATPVNASNQANTGNHGAASGNNGAENNSFNYVDDVFENALNQFTGGAGPLPGPIPGSGQAAQSHLASQPSMPPDANSAHVPSPPNPESPSSRQSAETVTPEVIPRLSQRELQLNSRRPAPDWDDNHQGADSDSASQRGDSSSSSASESPVSDSQPRKKSDTSAREQKEDIRPFEDLPFEDLDPSSFVLDRPEAKQEDRPTGHYDWIAEAPQSVWYVRHRNGAQYGPAVGPQMRTWVSEGRVTEGCHVWREGWANWRNAVDVFPQIREAQQATKNHANHQPVADSSSSQRSDATSQVAEQVGPATTRSKNRWLFPALLLFLTVVAVIVGVGIYQFLISQADANGPSQEQSSGEIIDPFADNNPEDDSEDEP